MRAQPWRAPLGLLPFAVAMAALALFARFVFVHAINVPFHDDILDILDFVLRFRDAERTGLRLQVLFEQYNDHRTAASRAIFSLMAWVQGEVDFRALSLLVTVAVPLLLLQYARALGGSAERAWLVCFAALVLASPRAYDFVSWPISAYAFYGVLVYAFAALLCLERPTLARVLLAAVFALASTYSLSSGRLTWLAGAVALWLAHLRGEPGALRHLALWLALTVVTLVLFHAGFDNRNPPGDLLRMALSRPLYELHYFLIVAGSGVSLGSDLLAAAAGAAMLLALGWLTWRDGIRRIGTLHLLAWLLVASCAAIAIGRAPYSGIENAATPRYSLGSLNLFLCLALLLARDLAARAAVKAALLALGGVLCIGNYLVYTPQLEAQLATRAGAFNAGTYWVFGHSIPVTNAIVQRAIDRGLYHPPARPLSIGRAR